MDLTILKNIGLSDGEIKIYQILLEHGNLPANQIITQSNLKRGDCYNKLYDLKRRGFVEEFTRTKKKHFRLDDPHKIEKYIHDQISAMTTTRQEINAILPSILSTYNLTYHKPGVQFFEGEEAMIRTQSDALTARTEIFQIVDSETLNQYFPRETAKYTTARIKQGIKKRILMPDTARNRAHLKNNRNDNYYQFTEVRLLPKDNPIFKTLSIIYDNKMSYLTLTPDHVVAILIEDEHIVATNRALFEFIWQQALTL